MNRPTFSRFLAPGTAVLVNDSQRLNAPGTIVEWSRLRHPIYGTPEAALVRMERFGSTAVIPHHTITAR